MAYRHPGMIERLEDKLGISESEAEELFDDTKRFLYLCATVEGPLAPSERIDEAWHHFILHTKDYDAFCRRYFGRFIHHVPHNRAERSKKDASGFCRMRSAALAAFGQPLSSNWGGTLLSAEGSNCKNTEPCQNGCEDCAPD